MNTRPPASHSEMIVWNQRSKAIRSYTALARRIGLLVVVSFAATFQLIWWQFLDHGLDISRIGLTLVITTALLAFTLQIPKMMKLAFWPTMNVLCGAIICGFSFLPEREKAIVFALTLMASMPALIVSHIAIYWITKPYSLKENGDRK